MLSFLRERLAHVATGARSLWDRANFVVQGDVPLFASILLAGLALVDWRADPPRYVAGTLAVLGVAGTFGFLGRDVSAALRHRSGWEFTPLNPVFDKSEVIVVAELPHRLETHVGTMLFCRDLNGALGTASTEIEALKDPFRVDGWLRRSADKRMKETGPPSPFNGKCLRLQSDLSLAMLESATPAPVGRTRYFDALCSNQLTRFRITKDGEAWPFRERYLFEPFAPDDDNRRLVPLAASRLANIVGVSTLAVTTDSHLVVVKQSRKSASSAALWAPSGSGSLEPQDLASVLKQGGPDDAAPTLQQLVVRGAVRELREECGLRPEAVLGSRVVGYGRWLEHGGKPEFVSLTRLAVTSSQIEPRPRWRLTEAAWTQSVKSLPVDLASWSDVDDPWEYDGWLAADLTGDEDLRGAVSLPLEFAFRCVVTALGRNPHMLDSL